MKKFFKWFFILILLAVAGAGGYYVYDNYIAKHDIRGAFGVVPSDAIFIMETSNLTDGWAAISDSKIWKTMLQNQHFKDINEYAKLLDEFLKNNNAADLLLRDRPMLISAHMISGKDYDFLFVVDLQSAKTLSVTFGNILKLVDGYQINKRIYHDTEIIEMIDEKNPNSIIYLSILDNLLVGTFTGSLMERAIDGKNQKYWENNAQYLKMAGELSSKKLFKFYFNYKKLPAFASVYSEGMDEYTASMAKALSFSAFDVNLEDNRLIFNGFSALDSMPSYFTALNAVKPGQMMAQEIISDQTALYLSIGFKNFNIFFRSLTDQFASGNAEDMEDYAGNVKLVEKLLGINVQKDFFDWIGEEIAFVKLRPKDQSRMEDVVVAIHANNIDKAKEGLDRITKHIKRRTPVKFEIEDYKNHQIYMLVEKGLFKLFFGKLFKKLEKPYFTYIEDYVVFSNSLDALKQIVDDYLKGHTLSHKKEFMDFMAEFDSRSNVTLFIQMPKLYDNLNAFSTADTKKTLVDNKDLIMGFNRIGFQLVSENDMFKTKIITDHNEDAGMNEQLERFEQSASDDLMKEDFDSLRFKIVLPDSILQKNKPYRAYFPEPSQTIMYEGKVSNNQANGLWRSFYDNGNLKSAINYKDGKVDGIAFFYYNDNHETPMAQVIFNQDVITGVYQEFFQNGAQKAKLNYKDGKLNGDAEFYYPTGRIKIKGEYKDDEKRGKWLFYNENGDVINKEKMKRKKN
jgi:antitoxin component YwqK of YwqJK toxin-antitoxin module